jgi:hypothetical protein
VGARSEVIGSFSAPTSWTYDVYQKTWSTESPNSSQTMMFVISSSLILSCKVNVDLDSVLRILLLDGVQEGMEPLG